MKYLIVFIIALGMSFVAHSQATIYNYSTGLLNNLTQNGMGLQDTCIAGMVKMSIDPDVYKWIEVCYDESGNNISQSWSKPATKDQIIRYAKQLIWIAQDEKNILLDQYNEAQRRWMEWNDILNYWTSIKNQLDIQP